MTGSAAMPRAPMTPASTHEPLRIVVTTETMHVSGKYTSVMGSPAREMLVCRGSSTISSSRRICRRSAAGRLSRIRLWTSLTSAFEDTVNLPIAQCLTIPQESDRNCTVAYARDDSPGADGDAPSGGGRPAERLRRAADGSEGRRPLGKLVERIRPSLEPPLLR